LRQRPPPEPKPETKKTTPQPSPQQAAQTTTAKSSRLSSAERRELGALPGRIDKLETRINEIEAQLATPGLYDQAPVRIKKVTEQLATTQAELEAAFKRWEALEGT